MRPVLGKHLTLDYWSWVPRRRMIGRSSSLMILASSARQSMSLGVAVASTFARARSKRAMLPSPLRREA